MINKLSILMYLELLFNKPVNKITQDELKKVSTITLEYNENGNSEDEIKLSQIINMLPNLKRLTIKNKIISNSLIDELSILNLESLSFENCSINSIVSLEKFNNLNELYIRNSSLLNYSILKTLNKDINKIFIQNPTDENEVDFSLLSNYVRINELYLEKCIIKNINKILSLQNLKILSVLWSQIVDVDDINLLLNLNNLEDIYISKYYESLESVKQLSLRKNVYYNLNHFVLEEPEIKNKL